MFRPALGVAGRTLLRRLCSQAVTAGSLSRPAGASRLRHLHVSQQSNARDAAGHRFGFLRRIVPSEVDWVEAGVVSPVVRKQKNCGSCWAIAVASSVEAVHYMNTLQAISLSVQELIDCDTENNGCEGGVRKKAFGYIQKKGLSSEPDYPYIDERSKSGCKLNKTVAARIAGFLFVNPTKDALEKAVAKQPVVVTLQSSDDLQKYKGGILDYKPIGDYTGSTHAVLIVGYGTDSDGVKYWRFKNSWGEDWGLGGFGRIRRHIADTRGALGIFMHQGVYPVFKD